MFQFGDPPARQHGDLPAFRQVHAHLWTFPLPPSETPATLRSMLQDEGRLKVSDPVAKYLPAFASLRTPSGKPANLTIAQLLTHTSGLGEASGPEAQQARTLADLGPLGMADTTSYPSDEQRQRLATAYARDAASGTLNPVPPRSDFGSRNRPPQGNGGLFSTGPNYARFCQMLLQGGTLDGRRYLSPEALRYFSTPQNGDLPTGFVQNDAFGQHGDKYGWGIGTCVLRTPHEGVASMLSPGSYGHGGAWGTQDWIDTVRRIAFLLMMQRSHFPNSDASDVRRAFQQAAVTSLQAAD